MPGKKFAWRREDILAASKAASKDNPDHKAEAAPSSGARAVWSDLRNIADGDKKGLFQSAPPPKA